REPELHKLVIREIIDRQVRDVIATSATNLGDWKVAAPSKKLICYSEELALANQELRKFLYRNVYYHPRVAEVNRRACEMLREVFEAYLADPDRLGEGATRRVEKEGLHRTVCDYIAGMTDRYVMEEYARDRR